jgi:hypothetical protein
MPRTDNNGSSTTVIQHGGGAATPLATREEVFGKAATTDAKAAPAETMRLHCVSAWAHLPDPTGQPEGIANLQLRKNATTGEMEAYYPPPATAGGEAAPTEKRWTAADGALDFRRDLKLEGPFIIAWNAGAGQVDHVNAPNGLGFSKIGVASLFGGDAANRSIRVTFFDSDQISKGTWLTFPKLQGTETDWDKWDGVTWTPWARENTQGFVTEPRNTFDCNEGARLLYLMPTNNGRVALNLKAWQDGASLSDIPEARIKPVLPNTWGNIDVTVPAGWAIDGVPARGVEELKIWKVPGQNAFTTSFTQATGPVEFDNWPTNVQLRLALNRGGFRTFLYIGAESGRVVGTYTNPNAGRAVGVAITQPVKI